MPSFVRFADRLESCLGTLPDLLAAKSAPLTRLAAGHIEAAERLAATDAESGGARLWREAAGDTAARFCHELIDAAADFPPLAGHHYPALFEVLAAGAVVRPAYGRHPRLAIWGLVEARLQQADLVVLGGLNEGTWPGPAAHDPWMSRQMRRKFEIAMPERAIGIAAHDFTQAIAAPEVALTRAARSEGAPTVPSRWLLRLDTVLRAVGLEGALGPDAQVQAAAGLLDAATYRPLPPPEPRPPLSARPRRLSVTQIETWLGDPYAIYARHILGLRALDELDADPGRADLGVRIHEALAEFVRRFPRELPADPVAELIAIGHRHFGAVLSRPGAWAFWWPRFERIMRWLVAEEATHRAAIVESLSEREGLLTLARPRRAVRPDRQGRPHRPPRGGRVSTGRLQDRRAAVQKKDPGRVFAAIAARRRDLARRQLWRHQRRAVGARILAAWRRHAGRPARPISTTATLPRWSPERSRRCRL